MRIYHHRNHRPTEERAGLSRGSKDSSEISAGAPARWFHRARASRPASRFSSRVRSASSWRSCETPARTDSGARGCGTCGALAGSPRSRREGRPGRWLRWRCGSARTPHPSARPPSPRRPAAAPAGHAAGGLQPGDVVTVDLAPDALRPARREALQVRAFVERLPDAVDPAPAERHVQRLCGGHGRHAGILLVNPQPHFRLAGVVRGQPPSERRFGAEALDPSWIGYDWRHARPTWCRVSRS